MELWEPKVTRLPLSSFRLMLLIGFSWLLLFAMKTDGICVDVALDDHLGAGFLQPGLDAGQAAEPDQIQIAGAEGTDRCGVIRDGDIFDVDTQLLAEFIGDQSVEPVQLLGLLIGDGADPQHGLVGLCDGWAC